MSGDKPPSHNEIMWAVHNALCKHGYAELTFRKIAAESSKSHSLLTYHYNTKENLITEYLEFLIGHLEALIEEADSSDPLERLNYLLDYFTAGTDKYSEQRAVAFLEFQTIAYRDVEFRAAMAEKFQGNIDLLAAIIEDGMEQGVFRPDLDSRTFAKFVMCALIGASWTETTVGIDGLASDIREVLSSDIFPALLLADAHNFDTDF